GRGLNEVRACQHADKRGAGDVVEGSEVAGAQDGLDMGVAASFAEGANLLVERLPVAIEHHLALDDDVDLFSAGSDGLLDLAELGVERREAMREGGRDGSNRDAGAFERLYRGRNERVVDTHGA